MQKFSPISATNHPIAERDYEKESDKKPLRLEDDIPIEIKQAIKDKNLVLVLGAGVSIPSKLPTWNNLISGLFLNVFDKIKTEDAETLIKLSNFLHGKNDLIMARYIERVHEEEGRQFWEKLYEILNIAAKHENRNINAIATLVESIGNGLKAIITYNYDTLVEEKLGDRVITVKADEPTQIDKIPIYHVHGVLPKSQEELKNMDLTLIEQDYHKHYENDMNSWANQIQLSHFRDSVCIFIGISLVDPNMRRILDIAKKEAGHKETYIVKTYQNIKDDKIEKATQYLDLEKEVTDLKQRKNATKIVNSILNDIEITDAESMKIRPVMLKDHDEIPDWIEKIGV